jgi:hypothetical protein
MSQADRTAAARRQAEYRRRLRYARCLWQVQTDVAVVDRLIELGWLHSADADDKDSVQAALNQFLSHALTFL